MATTFATPITVSANSPGAALRTGRAISGFIGLFLLADSIAKLVQPAAVLEASAHLGIPLPLVPAIGIILLTCTILYLIPATSILGAILLTGYLGGALLSHLRAGDPIFSHVLFPADIGALMWLSLLLREERLRALIPFRR